MPEEDETLVLKLYNSKNHKWTISERFNVNHVSTEELTLDRGLIVHQQIYRPSIVKKNEKGEVVCRLIYKLL